MLRDEQRADAPVGLRGGERLDSRLNRESIRAWLEWRGDVDELAQDTATRIGAARGERRAGGGGAIE